MQLSISSLGSRLAISGIVKTLLPSSAVMISCFQGPNSYSEGRGKESVQRIGRDLEKLRVSQSRCLTLVFVKDGRPKTSVGVEGASIMGKCLQPEVERLPLKYPSSSLAD